MAERILVAGASGFIGRALGRHLLDAGYEVVALTRRAGRAEPLITAGFNVVPWDARSDYGWSRYAENAAAIINLAGEPLADARWSAEKKQAIRQSRVDAVQAVIQAVRQVRNKPKLVIQASAIGIYGDRGDEPLAEDAPPGTGFLADLCQQSEQAAKPIGILGVRLAILRLGLVLGSQGGVLARLVPLFRRYLGGRIGNSRQWISWVHLHDVIGVVRFLLAQPDKSGVFNLTSPQPVQAQEFYATLGKVLHRPAGLPVPGFMLKWLKGEMAGQVLLASQRVIPQRLLDAEYRFGYPQLQPALEHILRKKQEGSE